MGPSDELLTRAEALVGSKPVAWRAAVGGYSAAERWSLDLADGRRVFVKLAPTEDLAWRLRDEHRHMTSFDADFRSDVIAWDDGERPMLVLEDLRDAHWPPPWEPSEVDRVLETLERVWSLPVPPWLQTAERFRDMFAGWHDVARDPDRFISLNVATRDWFDACLPTLMDAASSANLDGDAFLHLDVRSDNLCFTDDRVVLVDWNWASRGSPDLDLSGWLPSLRLEGGPLPDEIRPGLGAYAAGISAFFAANASLPPPQSAPTVRKFQIRQLRISLPWACRELGLPKPDGAFARAEIAQADEDLDAGRITEHAWYDRVEEALIDAYLATDDPRGQSGKFGDDETDWRWARELVLDVFPERATFLDVGCANGYLMESVARWGVERGLEVEPYGLDISWRIAALAKHRLPQWRDRIFVGNAIGWDPPMRFDVVQIGVDEVPPRRRRELVDRVLSRFVARDGKLVFRAGRAADRDVVHLLRDIGIEPDGVIEAVHPTTGELRITAWLGAR
jgi:hypothetical protein